MINTVSNLELLLHYYCSPEPHPRAHAPAIIEGTEYLLNSGMLENHGAYAVTDKGEAYIKFLMKVPFPVTKYVVEMQK